MKLAARPKLTKRLPLKRVKCPKALLKAAQLSQRLCRLRARQKPLIPMR